MPAYSRKFGRVTPRCHADVMSTNDNLIIDCDTCAMRDSDACGDCVVSFLIDRNPHEAVVLDLDQARAVKLLANAGMVPTLRHRAV